MTAIILTIRERISGGNPMSKRLLMILLVGLLLLVAISACAPPAMPETEATSAPAVELKPITVGLVTAINGIDEEFYSALAWKGIQEAQNLVPVKAEYAESQSETDYVKNLEQFVSKNTDLTISLGEEMADAVSQVASANPDASFVLIDQESTDPNVLGITFDVIPPSYMAGYLAGGMSKTGVVCIFGAEDTESITDYMTGFYNGADYYRRQNGVNLEILGWDVYSKEGTFLSDKSSEEEAYQITKDFFDKDCDVIFAVAKEAAQGSAKAAQEENKMFIGSHVDWYEAFPEYGNVILTSVMKKTDQVVFDSILSYAAGSFKGGETYEGTLQNNGVAMAPYHKFVTIVPQGMQEEINQVKENILTGHLRPAEPWIYEKTTPTAEEGSKE